MRGDLKAEVPQRAISVAVAQKKKLPLAKKGNVGSTMKIDVMGQSVTFTLKEVAAGAVEKATTVWLHNERDQDLLTESSLADIYESFEDNGQQIPAVGREICGITEVADGSRRRKTAILTKRSYLIWVGDLTDEQMTYLSDIGNAYTSVSAYERGQHYLVLSSTMNKSEISRLKKVDRAIINRCINTASLPKDYIKCFTSPNELSGKQGDRLYKLYSKIADDKQAIVSELCKEWLECKSTSPQQTDTLITLFEQACIGGKEKAEKPVERVVGTMGKLVVRGNKARLDLKGAPDELLAKIEQLILEHEATKN